MFGFSGEKSWKFLPQVRRRRFGLRVFGLLGGKILENSSASTRRRSAHVSRFWVGCTAGEHNKYQAMCVPYLPARGGRRGLERTGSNGFVRAGSRPKKLEKQYIYSWEHNKTETARGRSRFSLFSLFCESDRHFGGDTLLCWFHGAHTTTHAQRREKNNSFRNLWMISARQQTKKQHNKKNTYLHTCLEAPGRCFRRVPATMSTTRNNQR